MADDSGRTITRREGLTAGASLGGMALLAGCTDGLAGDGGDGGGGDGSYTVSMAPVGDVTLDAVPGSVTNYFPGYADMAVALGHGDSINSVGVTSRYHTDYYDELDGVSIDEGSLTELYQSGIDTEVFYELESDLHLIDPAWLVNNFDGMEQSDVDELADGVAPFLGNTIFRRTDDWHDYRYYSLYEAFETVAAMFRERERFAAFRSLHDAFVADVQTDLPPARERPNALLCYSAKDEPERFSPYRLSGKGTNKKQFRDLGIADALAGTGVEGLSTNDRGQIDYEAMLAVDPDSILLRGHERKTRAAFRDTVLAYMREHPTASELTAVQNGDVFRGGYLRQGPIHNLFLTERAAKQLSPEEFGDVTSHEQLFDRQRVADIVNGEL